MNQEEWQRYIAQAPNSTVQLSRRVEHLEHIIKGQMGGMTGKEETTVDSDANAKEDEG